MANNDILLLGIMLATQVGLLIVEIFGVNVFGYLVILIGAAGLLISAVISNIAAVGFWADMVGWSLGCLIMLVALIVVMFGKKALGGGGPR